MLATYFRRQGQTALLTLRPVPVPGLVLQNVGGTVAARSGSSATGAASSSRVGSRRRARRLPSQERAASGSGAAPRGA
jgi:hypothetical protein